MPQAHAYDKELAWLFTRELIGYALRRRYEVAKDLPLELLELVSKLGAGERNYFSGTTSDHARWAEPAERLL
jgi:hypothetical protein